MSDQIFSLLLTVFKSAACHCALRCVAAFACDFHLQLVVKVWCKFIPYVQHVIFAITRNISYECKCSAVDEQFAVALGVSERCIPTEATKAN